MGYKELFPMLKEILKKVIPFSFQIKTVPLKLYFLLTKNQL